MTVQIGFLDSNTTSLESPIGRLSTQAHCQQKKVACQSCILAANLGSEVQLQSVSRVLLCMMDLHDTGSQDNAFGRECRLAALSSAPCLPIRPVWMIRSETVMPSPRLLVVDSRGTCSSFSVGYQVITSGMSWLSCQTPRLAEQIVLIDVFGLYNISRSSAT